jgi:hypothetical protein
VFGLKKRDIHVDEPHACERVCALLRERGPLFLEARFRHVSSDYYILNTDVDVARVFDWFSGRGGGKTPLLIDPARELAAKAKPLLEAKISHPGWEAAIAALAQNDTLALLVEADGGATSFLLLEDEDEWDTIRRRIPAGGALRAYSAMDFGRRRSTLTAWSGGAG